jgi:hypothetical protein
MKQFLLLLTFIMIGTGSVLGQSPDMFNYQAVARNDQGEIISNQSVGIKISILQSSSTGSVIYAEEHNLSTNENGLVTMMVGNGTEITGSFSNIDWSEGPYFIKVGMDETGGTSYTTMGTTQLVSVPYAKYADSAAGTFSGNYSDLQNAPDLNEYVDTATTTTWDKDSTDDFSGNYGDLTNKPVDVDGVATDNIKDGAVTESKIEDRSITTEKLDYQAVDSSRLNPTALTKWLRPTLQWDHTYSYVGINREFGITSSSSFGISSDAGVDAYGGMYVNTEDSEGYPFYGYAANGNSQAWHHYDHGDKRWRLVFNWSNPITRLLVNQDGVMPGGDGALKLGSSSHRWSEVHATNGTIQTSDRRLKKGIEPLAYGLEEILQLQPVSYQWESEENTQDSGGKQHLGLVAQDVRKVIGEVVNKPSGKGKYLGMSYSELIPVLVRAIQEQQKTIENQTQALQKKNDKLQTQIELLRKRIQKLAQQNKEEDARISDIKGE